MKPDTYGRGLYLAVLVFVSLLSVVGNAVYAYAATASTTPSLPPGWAAAAHMIPPVLLLLVTEVLATASTRFTGRGRAWALSGVVVIAAAAFTLSFDALYEVARMAKVRAELAWLVPVMLDVAIIVCTVLVLMASRQIQRDRALADRLVAGGGSTNADWVADRPTTSAVADPTLVDPVADQPVSQVADQPAAVADSVADQPVTGGSPQAAAAAASEPPVAAAPQSATDEVADRPVAGGPVVVADTVDPPASQTADSVADQPAATVADFEPEVADLADLAERVHRESGTTKPVEIVAQVLELARQGDLSQRAIAAEAGVDRTLVSRWTKVAEGIDRPQLAAVK
ncbi:hypothetical protein GCM10010528_23170 [Gordonia defluvii]|uniref:DUF2637 domain-containing protein n=1 Tax=Gordonia defluvii TaxID=283718 RepID=A0ABP6LKF2_9ACTN